MLCIDFFWLKFININYLYYIKRKNRLKFVSAKINKIMRKLKQNKLSLKKFQIAKINNPNSILGGDPLTRTITSKKSTRPGCPVESIIIEG